MGMPDRIYAHRFGSWAKEQDGVGLVEYVRADMCQSVVSLRDHFAAQAFGSIMGTITGMGDVDPDEAREVFVKLGKAIYDAADAMLEARNVR